MPGFVDFMYKNILPACFLAPLKPTFDLNDGHTFVVRQHLQCMYIVCGNIGLGPYSVCSLTQLCCSCIRTGVV